MVYLVRALPPEIELDAGDRIGFVNRFDYRADTTIKDKHDTAYYEGIGAFALGLTGDTLPDRRVSFFQAADTGISRTPALFLNNELPENEINAFCRNHQATHLLTLDSLRLGFDWETVREEDEEGSVSKTKYFYLIGNYYLSLYDSAGVPVKKTLLERSMEYTARPTLSALITIVPNLARAVEKIKILARDAAVQYTDLFYPSEEKLPRNLHAGKPFRESNALIRKQEYDAAIGLLTKLAADYRKGVARKARQNLAVATELRDNRDNR